MRSFLSLHRRVSPTWPTTARISPTTTTVRTHAIPFHSGRKTAARWISLFAIAIASRTRSTTGPVSRSSRERRTRGERRSEPTTGTQSSPLSEIEENRAGESYLRDVGQQRLGSVLSFCPVDLVETLRYVAAVQRRSERAQIDQEEPIARRI